MIDRRTRGIRAGARKRLSAAISLGVLLGTGGASLWVAPGAAAMERGPALMWGQGGGHSDNIVTGDVIIGNGKLNRNQVTSNSPSINSGNQIIENAAAGGVTNTQAAFCKKHHHHRCLIRQKAVFWAP